MSKNNQFFLRLAGVSIFVLIIGYVLDRNEWFSIPSAFPYLVGYYILISLLAFFINLKGTEKEGEIAVWYYLSSVVIKFLLAAASVFVLVKMYENERTNIVWLSFVLYPLYEAVVTLDIYRRVQ